MQINKHTYNKIYIEIEDGAVWIIFSELPHSGPQWAVYGSEGRWKKWLETPETIDLVNKCWLSLNGAGCGPRPALRHPGGADGFQ